MWPVWWRWQEAAILTAVQLVKVRANTVEEDIGTIISQVDCDGNERAEYVAKDAAKVYPPMCPAGKRVGRLPSVIKEDASFFGPFTRSTRNG